MKAADNAMHTYSYTKPYAALPHVFIQNHHNDKLTTKSCIKQNSERRNLIFELIPLV